MNITELKDKVIAGEAISREEALELYTMPLTELCDAADAIRQHFCGNRFDICTIINVKSGRCPEDCKYCSQSSHYNTSCAEYPLLADSEIVDGAREYADKGVLRYSLVASGRGLTDSEVERICTAVSQIKGIHVCGSLGLLNESQYKRLFEAGLTRIHNNLETSRNNFPNMCTTHSFDDKINAINQAQAAGMDICSGGIFGIGETAEDRVELALSLRSLGIKSVPMNILNPIKGTPYADKQPLTSDEMCRIVAVYRFILPNAFLRLAGGRGLLADKGRGCFQSGANAAITGDMLTTSGISVETDFAMLHELGFDVVKDKA